MTTDVQTLVSEATGLLKSLIAIPSLSREEERAADFLQNYIEMQGMATGRKGNNIWCLSPMFDLQKPTLLLNSHIDTVKPWEVTTPARAWSACCRCSCNFAAPHRRTT